MIHIKKNVYYFIKSSSGTGGFQNRINNFSDKRLYIII